MFELKSYQLDCLNVLETFLRDARDSGAKEAFNRSTTRPMDAFKRQVQYAVIPSWPESEAFPYVCLRVPTGGGKTIIGAYSVGLACRAYLQAERATVLWLAPSNTIVEQTLKAFRNRRHPYRAALDEAFGGCVTILSVPEALSVKPGTLNADTTIIVATMQTFRVADKDGRLVYRGNGDLIDHFNNLPPSQLKLLERTDADGNPVAADDPTGTSAKSLANVLRLRMPLVIVDEAHNARSDLSYETLRRFNPSGILEFTATPAPHTKKKVGSNVLYGVSAAELKAEQMIKMPIRLVNRSNPHEAISSAITKREELERLAAAEEKTSGDYIRPIVLFQAQSRSGDEERITPDVLRDWLIKDFDVKPEEVAIRTGEKDELPDDPAARDCPLKYVITVNALREGWDCPFAYVLCSVANMSAKGAVEQLLGRILRLPYAKSRETPALNEAFAYATSKDFTSAAQSLKDALVQGGFERFEADAAVTLGDSSNGGGGGTLPLFDEAVSEVVSEKPSEDAIAALPREIRQSVTFETRADTKEMEIKWSGGLLTNPVAKKLQAVFSDPVDRRAIIALQKKTEGQPSNPAALGERLAVPRLAIKHQKEWTLFEPGEFDIAWSLNEANAALTQDDLDPKKTTTTGATIDVEKEGKFAVELLQRLSEQMQLRDLRGPKTPEKFVDWLDAEILIPEATQDEKRLYLDRVMAHLIGKRGLTFEELLPLRWRLVMAIEDRINQERRRALKSAYQSALFEDAAGTVECRPEVVFDFPNRLGKYPAPSEYDGSLVLRKHYYENIGAMESEEASCAAFIASHPNVDYWVRNLTSGAFAFRMPLADRGFYPDFVAKLKDDGIAVIEYKGEVYKTNDDSKEKKAFGNLWASRSGGKCVFAFVGKDGMTEDLDSAFAPLRSA